MSNSTASRDWRVERTPGADSRLIRDGQGIVAEVFADDGGKEARLIVRAVRSHDALVKALEACVFALGRSGANVAGGPSRAEWDQARAALSDAQAE